MRIAVVTGANKGIGLEICKQLASNGVMVILTSRDEKKGLEAVAKLLESGLSNVAFHRLDVMDANSIASLAKFIATQHGKLDILVNNAGVSGATVDWEPFRTLKFEDGKSNVRVAEMLSNGLIDQTNESAEECVKTNYYGTKAVTEALLPCLLQSNSGRIVNVSSGLGMLQFISNERARTELNEVDVLSLERIDEIVKLYLEDFKEDKLQEKGWGPPPTQTSAYTISKAAMNACTRATAKSYPTLLINCVCPGFVKTDMTSGAGFFTVDVGARGPVMLALLPDGGPSGLFFQNMEPSIF